MKPNHWSNVPGEIIREVTIEPNGQIYDVIDDAHLPFGAGPLPAVDGEFVIHFRSSGYDAPATWSDPPEHGDDRELECVEFVWTCNCRESHRDFVDDDLAQQLFDHYREAIDSEELCVTE